MLYRCSCKRRGFAQGWQYALQWLVILPFEISAAGITIDYWRSDINIGVWIAVFLTVLIVVQFFGVRGYGEGWYHKLVLLIFLSVDNRSH